MAPCLYPPSPREAVAALYVGKTIGDVPTPAAVINVAAARRNCERMLQACDSLGLAWRAHVKTHKTAEMTRLQLGDDARRPASIVVSTLAEAEFLQPLLAAYRAAGRRVNVLYGLPVARSAVPRLAAVARALGPGSVSVLLDDAAQLPAVADLGRAAGAAPLALLKIDMGGRRAGVVVGSPRFGELADAALAAHGRGALVLAGLYSHAGHSYAGDGRAAAVAMLQAELGALLAGADGLRARAADLPPLVLSAGASPTALALQNLAGAPNAAPAEPRAAPAEPRAAPAELRAATAALAALLGSVRARGHAVEVHAGVYPTLDLQQLAAHSVAASRLSWRDMALTVLAEVHSLYPGRGAGGSDEALIGAGVLALGREPCKAYDGMAMVTPWGRRGVAMPRADVEAFRGWIVGRFSQEHGVLTWRDAAAADPEPVPEQDRSLAVGQKLRLWPNHACITSSHFGWYFVVDEDRGGREDEIVDVWIRAKGW